MLAELFSTFRRCRIHGLGCQVPWGYDEQHTDSPRPYTVDELAVRAEPPHRYAYPSLDEYVAGFRLYRALRRDRDLTDEERAVAMHAKLSAGGFPQHLIDEFFPST